MHALAGQQQVEPVGGGIVSADRGARLDRRDDQPVVEQFELYDLSGEPVGLNSPWGLSGNGQPHLASGLESVQVARKQSGLPDVPGADQARDQPLQADGETAVGGHAVLESFEVGSEALYAGAS